MSSPAVEPSRFRRVLGHFPTGVAVITAVDTEGRPVGMAVGSFTSVSLDPPLVAFLPDRSSTSWPRIREAGSFCVNILGADQESVCRAFAVRGGDKFADLTWTPAGSGSPLLDGVLAWVDCDIAQVSAAGDHDIVIGAVRDLGTGDAALPLVFFQGGYGRFHALSLAAWEGDLAVQMRSADLARGPMEQLAAELDAECVASAVVGEQMVLVARAGEPRAPAPATEVGRRLAFRPPLGTAFAAWAPPPARQAWLARVGPAAAGGAAALETALEATLEAVRLRGYAVGRDLRWMTEATHAEIGALLDALPADYESPDTADTVATVSVPVFGPAAGSAVAGPGPVVLVLSVTVPAPGEAAAVERSVRLLRAAARQVTAALDATA